MTRADDCAKAIAGRTLFARRAAGLTAFGAESICCVDFGNSAHPVSCAEHSGNLCLLGDDIHAAIPKLWSQSQLIDGDGREVARGTARKGVAELGTLPAGYYEIREPHGNVNCINHRNICIGTLRKSHLYFTSKSPALRTARRSIARAFGCGAGHKSSTTTRRAP